MLCTQSMKKSGSRGQIQSQGHLKYLLLSVTWDQELKYHIHVFAFRKKLSDSWNLHLQYDTSNNFCCPVVRFIGYIYIYSMDFHDKNIYNTEQVVFFRIHKIIFYLWFVTKKPTGLDGNLNTISLFMDLSGSLVLHIRLHLLVKFIHICLVPSLLLVDVWKPSKLLKGGGVRKTTNNQYPSSRC